MSKEKVSLSSTVLFPLFVTIFLLLIGSFSTCYGEANWVVLSSIRDLTDNVNLQDGQALIAGHSYNVTFTVNVPYTQTQSEFQVSLYPEMGQHSTQFWFLLSSYGGYDPNKFTAGLQNISFNQVEGELALSVLFSIPQDFTITSGNLNQHFIKSNISIVTAKVTGGATVGTLQGQVSDQAIQAYLVAYSQKSTYISQGKIDSTYTTVVNGILTQAQTIYSMGLPENALAVLDVIEPSNFPAPPNNTLNTLLIIAVAAILAIAVLTAIAHLRTRSKLFEMNYMVSEVQKELAALEVSVAQFDRKLGDQVKALKDRMGENT